MDIQKGIRIMLAIVLILMVNSVRSAVNNDKQLPGGYAFLSAEEETSVWGGVTKALPSRSEIMKLLTESLKSIKVIGKHVIASEASKKTIDSLQKLLATVQTGLKSAVQSDTAKALRAAASVQIDVTIQALHITIDSFKTATGDRANELLTNLNNKKEELSKILSELKEQALDEKVNRAKEIIKEAYQLTSNQITEFKSDLGTDVANSLERVKWMGIQLKLLKDLASMKVDSMRGLASAVGEYAMGTLEIMNKLNEIEIVQPATTAYQNVIEKLTAIRQMMISNDYNISNIAQSLQNGVTNLKEMCQGIDTNRFLKNVVPMTLPTRAEVFKLLTDSLENIKEIASNAAAHAAKNGSKNVIDSVHKLLETIQTGLKPAENLDRLKTLQAVTITQIEETVQTLQLIMDTFNAATIGELFAVDSDYISTKKAELGALLADLKDRFLVENVNKANEVMNAAYEKTSNIITKYKSDLGTDLAESLEKLRTEMEFQLNLAKDLASTKVNSMQGLISSVGDYAIGALENLKKLNEIVEPATTAYHNFIEHLKAIKRVLTSQDHHLSDTDNSKETSQGGDIDTKGLYQRMSENLSFLIDSLTDGGSMADIKGIYRKIIMIAHVNDAILLIESCIASTTAAVQNTKSSVSLEMSKAYELIQNDFLRLPLYNDIIKQKYKELLNLSSGLKSSVSSITIETATNNFKQICESIIEQVSSFEEFFTKVKQSGSLLDHSVLNKTIDFLKMAKASFEAKVPMFIHTARTTITFQGTADFMVALADSVGVTVGTLRLCTYEVLPEPMKIAYNKLVNNLTSAYLGVKLGKQAHETIGNENMAEAREEFEEERKLWQSESLASKNKIAHLEEQLATRMTIEAFTEQMNAVYANMVSKNDISGIISSESEKITENMKTQFGNERKEVEGRIELLEQQAKEQAVAASQTNKKLEEENLRLASTITELMNTQKELKELKDQITAKARRPGFFKRMLSGSGGSNGRKNSSGSKSGNVHSTVG